MGVGACVVALLLGLVACRLWLKCRKQNIVRMRRKGTQRAVELPHAAVCSNSYGRFDPFMAVSSTTSPSAPPISVAHVEEVPPPPMPKADKEEMAEHKEMHSDEPEEMVRL